MKRSLKLGAMLAAVALVWTTVRAQGPSFDKLSAADRAAFTQRFEKEIWPLMQRGGKRSCVGCHSGGIVSALKLSGNPGKDFPMLLKDGFLIPNDAGSLLSRITDGDPERRMPKDGKPWDAQDVQTLRTFVAELDQKQQKK